MPTKDKSSFAADNEAIYYGKNKKKNNNSNNDSSDDKDKKKKNKNLVSGNSLETTFKIFAVGAFLLGIPAMVGIFAAAIAAVIAYKGIKWYRNKKKDNLEATKTAFKAFKKGSPEELPEKDKNYLDIALNKEKEPANDKDFINKIKDETKKFLDSDLGKKAIDNKELNNLFKKATGMDLKELNEKIDTLEKESAKKDKEFEKEQEKQKEIDEQKKQAELEKKEKDKEELNKEEEIDKDKDKELEDDAVNIDNTNSPKEEKEEEPTIDNSKPKENSEPEIENINEYPRESEVNDPRKSDASIDAPQSQRSSIDAPDPADNRKLMDIPDKEFDREIASKEDIEKEAKQTELEKNAPEISDEISKQ